MLSSTSRSVKQLMEVIQERVPKVRNVNSKGSSLSKAKSSKKKRPVSPLHDAGELESTVGNRIQIANILTEDKNK